MGHSARLCQAGRRQKVDPKQRKARDPSLSEPVNPRFTCIRRSQRLHNPQWSARGLWTPWARSWKEGSNKPEATDSPQLCPPACPHPHSAYLQERCIQPAPRGPRSRKHLATPTPHACPPRAGLAPPLLVFGWLPHVLAFRPRDLTAVHVR